MVLNRFSGFGVVIVALVLWSCGSAKKTTASGNKGKNGRQVACPVIEGQPQLSWYVESNLVLDSIKMKQPPGAKVYSLDTTEAKEFFRLFRDSAGKYNKVLMTLPLPAPNECKTFDVSVSGVMNAKLREKYPEIIALEGRATNGRGDARINYDGHKMKIQVNMNGEIILINALRHRGRTYYVVYARAASTDKKEPFEESGKPQNENKK
jgi:hypothetical protein